MSVDNNAILYVGLPFLDIPTARTDNDYLRIKDFCDWKARESNLSQLELSSFGYHVSNDGDFVGFLVCDSGSYGQKEIENCAEVITLYKNLFEKMFNLKAKVYLFNYQW